MIATKFGGISPATLRETYYSLLRDPANKRAQGFLMSPERDCGCALGWFAEACIRSGVLDETGRPYRWETRKACPDRLAFVYHWNAGGKPKKDELHNVIDSRVWNQCFMLDTAFVWSKSDNGAPLASFPEFLREYERTEVE